ncbi:MAG: MiaB/RimO family radical SAM methylthiotransferase [Oscillospiraceae bacterium]|jgi:threonylcarbamoyladenosine tRNA methylthiotransferase MtaB|nr:MiaB/RimO family radical SAM methylthiotransferase [Oscillospiraceae bacterium]
MRIAIVTLGCRTNQAESAGMAELLRMRGHEVVPPGGDGVDAVLVNTCTVTATADKKSRNAVRRLRGLYPGALLAVCGCLPQTARLDIEGIGLVGGTADRAGFVDELERLSLRQGSGHETVSLVKAVPDGGRDDTPLPDARPLGRSRAYIKIQDGCDNRCAYCKVPLARGRSRSRPVESVLRAARDAAEGGASELVLTGIEISSFRSQVGFPPDTDGRTGPATLSWGLAELTAAVCRAANPVPVRLSSLHPDRIDGAFTDALKRERNFRPVFHLSLQSCCDKTLAAMGRRYAVRDIFAAFAHLRGVWDKPAVTADIIVGFPGETDGDFEETFQNLLSLRPDGLHVFPYSRREGTPAAGLPDQNTRAVKTARAKRLAEAFPKGQSPGSTKSL